MSKGKKMRGPARGGLPGMGGMNMGGGMGNLMSQMQKLQDEMEKTQNSLVDVEVTASSGGGMVTVVATASQEIRSITIKPEVVNPEDVELLQDMILAAVTDALQKGKAVADERMGALTGGMGLPPGLGF